MKQKDFNHYFTQAISKNLIDVNDFILQIKDGPHLSASLAVKIYQEDYRARLTGTLKNTYKGIHAIIGDHDFAIISQDYINFQPSVSPNLDDYGNQFSYFLKTHFFNKTYFFLDQLADFEWSIREIFNLEEIIGATPLELTNALQGENKIIQLISTANVFNYNFLITSLYALKDSETKEIIFDFKRAEYIVIYKKSLMVKTYSLTKNQYFLMKLLSSPIKIQDFFINIPVTMISEEIQQLFEILGQEQLILL